MFYVVKSKISNLLPHQQNDLDNITVEIWTRPVEDDVFKSIKSIGKYETIDEARNAIKNIFGVVRNKDQIGEAFELLDEAKEEYILDIFKPGKYEPLSAEDTGHVIFDSLEKDVDVDTTDERIAELVIEYEEDANSHGCTLIVDCDLEGIMFERRQELRDEQD